MRKALALLALAFVVAVAASCGGSDEAEEDPTAAWASGFCTAITSWTDELQSITSQFSDTSNLSQEGIQSAADDAKSATEQLVDDLRGLGSPETESGQEVRVRHRWAFDHARKRSREDPGHRRRCLRHHGAAGRDHDDLRVAVRHVDRVLRHADDDPGRRRARRARVGSRRLARVRRDLELGRAQETRERSATSPR